MATEPHRAFQDVLDDGNSGFDDSLDHEYITEDGTSLRTRETDGGTIEEQCPSCGNWYQQISSHWALSSCNHPPISVEKFRTLQGLLMGDGCLSTSYKNPYIDVSNTNITFLEYIMQEFGWFFGDLYLFQTYKQSADTEFDNEYILSTNNFHDVWRTQSRSHPVLEQFESWYDTGEKVFPQIQYTAEQLRMWYVSDGCIDKANMSIHFISANESVRPQNIVQNFAEIGIAVSNGNNGKHFYVSMTDTERFFDFIGHDPVPGFGYKWAYDDRDEYERLKEKADREHKTQHEEKPAEHQQN